MCDGIASLDITPLNFSISAVCSGLCEVLQQSQLHKFHFDFFRLCGRQFCECASFTAVRKFHRRVAHLSSLRACFYQNGTEDCLLAFEWQKHILIKDSWGSTQILIFKSFYVSQDVFENCYSSPGAMYCCLIGLRSQLSILHGVPTAGSRIGVACLLSCHRWLLPAQITSPGSEEGPV